MKESTLLRVLALIITLCGGQAHAAAKINARKITAGAAISMKDALENIASSYTAQHPEPFSGLTLTFGATATIVRQIENKASIDVFISADRANVDKLVSSGNIDKNEVTQIATNEVLLVAAARDSTIKDLESFLDDEKAGRVALCQPNVPIGNYAQQILTKLSFLAKAKNRSVTADNVRAALAMVLNGGAKAAFIYRTDYKLHERDLRILPLPPELQVSASYFAAPVKYSLEKKGAKEFVQFLTSESARKILLQFGFQP